MLAALMFVEFATLNLQAVLVGYTAGQYSSTHVATASEAAANRIVLANAHADLYRVGQAISAGTALGGTQVFYGRTITAIEVVDASNKALVFDGAPVNIAAGNIVYNSGWKTGFASGVAATSGCIVANDGKYPCSYRGIESLWGDVWEFVDGLNVNERQAWAAKDAADYASNLFASPYEQLAFVDGDTNGNVKAMGWDIGRPWGALPLTVGGGSATYYSDSYFQTTGQRVARVGGGWNGGAGAGPSSWYLDYASPDASRLVGGRLVRKAVAS